MGIDHYFFSNSLQIFLFSNMSIIAYKEEIWEDDFWFCFFFLEAQNEEKKRKKSFICETS